MVDSADYVLAVWNNNKSGSTYRTNANISKRKSYKLINETKNM